MIHSAGRIIEDSNSLEHVDFILKFFELNLKF